MKTVFHGKKISSVLGILPETISYFDDEVDNYTFPAKQTMKLKRVMGFDTHRMAKPESFTSDFCIFGVKYLLDNNVIQKDEIGAVIVVTLSPDYFLPHISNTVQGEVDLPDDVLCLDIAQGCCGYIVGLMQAFMLLDHMPDKKVLVCTADVLSKKVSKKDRNDYPLIGDGASVSIVENDPDASDIHYIMYMDGKDRDVLRIPAGGFRMPNTPETGELHDVGDGNLRALDHMHMDGSAVFSFVQACAPPCIEEALEFAGKDKDSIDYFLFHQPNKFMVQKLREKLEVPSEKVPDDLVVKYGNPSGTSIPMILTDHLSEQMEKGSFDCCLSAFGSGLAWGTMIMKLGNMKLCRLVSSDL